MFATDRFDPIVGNSEVIHDLRSFVIEMSLEKGPLLLTGPTGVGKRLAARKIHAAGGIPAARLLFVSGQDFEIQDLYPTEDQIPALVQMGTVYINSAQQIDPQVAQQLKELIQSDSSEIPRIILGVDVTDDGGLKLWTSTSPLSKLEFRGSFSIPALGERPEDISAIARYQIWTSARPEDFESRWMEFTRSKLGELLVRPWNGNVPELMEVVQSFCSKEAARSETALLGSMTESVSAHWLQEQIDRMHENLMERWNFEGSLQSGGTADEQETLR
ncbi:MAG TPA: hypothetical protein EYQ08_02860 [Planctomycetes bacterium]|nr:hypothetical protein [Planctomycetota bacterium]HIK81674.1 hypothetical protein [Planctomycetota bacterium]